jgi:two-component system, NarL family, sensor kinase
VLLVTAAGVIVATVELVQTPTAPDDYRNGALIAICYAVPYAVTGAFLIARRPDLPFGWLLAAAAVLAAVGTAADAMIYVAVIHGASQRLAFVVYALSITQLLPTAIQGLVNVRFPSGRLRSRRARLLEIALITGIVLGFAAGLLGDQTLPLRRPDGSVEQVSNPLTHGTLVGRIADDLTVVVPVVILLGLIAGLGVVRRAWQATGIERYQLRWRAYGVVFSLLGFPLAVFTNVLPVVIDLLDGLLFVITLAIPVVWYRLWAIDTVIRRSAAYALVTIAVAGMFALITAVGTTVASQRTGFIVGAAVACVMFGPALGYSQRLVDRFFYGHRNDPYRALSDIGRRLAVVAVPGEVLPAVVTGVAESLRLPYVAIERPADGSVLAAYGEPGVPVPAGTEPASTEPASTEPASTERWPLSYQGVTVGTLVARPRRGEQSFDPRDQAVLGDIARQAGAAVHAQALTADLLDSRQRLVSAREEERRRLRRDLHDGLGPLLTSVGLNIDAARVHADRDQAGPRAENQDLGVLLGRAKEGAAQAIADLRGIVYGLRPSSLDDLGLAGAIAAHIRRLGEGTGMRVTLQADQPADLPAAVEVAGFRIAVEAVNNAVRHSTARNCQVRLEIDTLGQLVVEVRDDGTGDGPWPAGVGLLAMRERAAELGGTLIAGPSTGGGLVRACLPVPVRATS